MDTDAPTLGLLTEDEKLAVKMAGELWNLLCKIVGSGETRSNDLDELIAPIHLIQRYVMSNAAARAYPNQLRSLGWLIEDQKEPAR